jgi:hypothetical protein
MTETVLDIQALPEVILSKISIDDFLAEKQ